VVKVCEEDLLPNSAYAVAKAMATADAASKKEDNDVTNEDDEEEKVELASALFGKPMPQAVKQSTEAAAKKNGGVVGAYILYIRYVCSFDYLYCILFLPIANNNFHL